VNRCRQSAAIVAPPRGPADVTDEVRLLLTWLAATSWYGSISSSLVPKYDLNLKTIQHSALSIHKQQQQKKTSSSIHCVCRDAIH
jgi:hypothetical protein